MNTVQRYTWEDALIDAQAQGIIPNGALLVALKLSKAINWEPRDKRPSGLYWKNEDALKAVGSSRASYYKFRDVLFDNGFFIMRGGNLLPQVPESLVETEQSSVETKKSLVETEKSPVDNPYSEDTYSEDVLSVDEYSEELEAPVSASASTVTSSNLREEGKSRYSFKLKDSSPSSNNEYRNPPIYAVDLSSVTGAPQSLVETTKDKETDMARMDNRAVLAEVRAAMSTVKRYTKASDEFWAAVEEIAMDEDFKTDVTNPMQRVGHAQAVVAKQLAAVGGW